MPTKHTISATYETKCPWCDEMIYEDDEIARDPDGGEWLHSACWDEAVG